MWIIINIQYYNQFWSSNKRYNEYFLSCKFFGEYLKFNKKSSIFYKKQNMNNMRKQLNIYFICG